MAGRPPNRSSEFGKNDEMSIAANSLRTYFFRIATAVMGFLIGVLIARFLGPSGKGYYSGVFLYYGLLVQVFGSFATAIVYQITRKGEEPKTVFITATVYSLGIGIAVLALMGLYRFISPDKPDWPILLVFCIFPLTLVMSNFSGVFQGLNRIITLNWIGISQALFQLVLLSVGFFGFRIKVEEAIGIWFVSQLAAIAVTLWMGREFWLPPLRHQFSGPLLRSMLGFGWQISLVTVVGILNSRIDSLFVLNYLKAREYGLYSVSVNAAEILWYASSAIAVAICARVGTTERDPAASLTARAVRHTLIINLPLAILMWCAAWLIPWVYTAKFSEAVLPFRILLPGVLFYSVAGIFYTFFSNQLGKPRYTLLVSTTALVVDGLACLAFIPSLGMTGAAWANTISYLIATCLTIFLFCKETGITVTGLLRITRDDVADYRLLFLNIRSLINRKSGRP